MQKVTNAMKILITLLLWAIASQCFSDSSVWKASKGNSEILLGGTFHLLGEADYPLPGEFDRAYSRAQLLVLETDMGKMAGAQFQQQVMQRLTYRNGKTLKGELSLDTYNELKAYCTSREINLADFEHFKPPFLTTVLVITEMQRLGIAGTGVDQHFYQRAIIDVKTIKHLESLESQLEIIVNMGKGYEDEMVMSTLRDMKELGSVIAEMKSAWRNGDLKKIERLGFSEMRKDHPALYQSMIVERNEAWLSHMDSLIATTETELVLVGVLHMVGSDGVLNRLRQRGFTIKQF